MAHVERVLRVLAVSILAASFAAHTATAQGDGATDPFVVDLVPALVPWPTDGLTSAVQGASAIAELNIAKVTMGPCRYRALHNHLYADELMYVASNELFAFQVAPNNTAYTHNLTRGDHVVFPRGWFHYLLNPTCTATPTIIVFNAKSIGTINLPQNLQPAPEAYKQAAFNTSSFPSQAGLWVTDAACATRCRLTAGGAPAPRPSRRTRSPSP